MGSDRRLVTARIRLSLRTSKTPAKKKNYDWSELQNYRYTVTIRNRYAELSNGVQDATEKYAKLVQADGVQDATEKYAKLVQADTETAEKLIAVKKKKKQRKVAEDPRIVDARTDVQKAFEKYQ